MNSKHGLSYAQVAFIALLTEMLLIAIQIVYEILSGNEGGFTSDYMKNTGFYIFQIPGFFIYVAVVFVIARLMREKILNKILLFVVAGGIVEISFYLVVQADYRGVFVYSVLDKFIGAAFGLVLSLYRPTASERDSYL